MVKIIINQLETYEDIEVEIRCSTIDAKVEDIINKMNMTYASLIGKYKDKKYTIPLENIYYIESIDNKVYIYEEKRIFDSSIRLYEIERKLEESHFVRISKSCILNIDKLESVKSLLNGKYEAYLLNGEKIIISRHYVPLFKKKFGIGR